jgi:diaminopimelate decarboxylase
MGRSQMKAGDRRGQWPLTAAFGGRRPVGRRMFGERPRGLFGTPLIVVDEADVRERCRRVREAFPRALLAVKAVPAGALIRNAVEESLGLLIVDNEQELDRISGTAGSADAGSADVEQAILLRVVPG